MKRSFFLSLLLHSMLFASLGLGVLLSKKRGIEIPNDTAIMVNFTKIGPRSQAPIIGQTSAPLPCQEALKKQEAPKKAPTSSPKENKKALPEKGDIAKKNKTKIKNNEQKKEDNKNGKEGSHD